MMYAPRAIGVYVRTCAPACMRARACTSSCKLRRQLPALAAWLSCASENGVFRSSLVCAFLKKEILNIDEDVLEKIGERRGVPGSER